MNDNEMMDAMAAAVKQYVDEATAPLRAEIVMLKADLSSRPTAEVHAAIVAKAAIDTAASVVITPAERGPAGESGAPGEAGPQGETGPEGKAGPPGESVHVDSVRLMVLEEIGKAVGVLPRAQDGKSVTIEEVRPLIQMMVDAIPRPQNGAPGKDADPMAVVPAVLEELKAPVADMERRVEQRIDGIMYESIKLIPAGKDGLPGPQGERGEAGEPGRSVEVDPTVIKSMVDEAVAALPPAKDGESVHPDTIRVMVTEAVETTVAKALEALPEPVAGKDADPIAIAAAVHEEIARQFDAMRPYIKGEPGNDGLGLDDLSVDLKEDGRTLVLTFSRDDREKTFELECPWMIYRGVYIKGSTYKTGDTVTYGGSTWVARRQTELAPGTDDWQLSVKRGQDAK